MYISEAKVNTVRELIAARNWQDSDKLAYVERIAVLALVIDWAQGRTEAPAPVAEVMDDSHIGSGSSGYGLGQRIELILAHLRANHSYQGDVTEHGTRVAVLYAPVTAEGLDALEAWLQAQPERAEALPLGEADATLDMHPNVRRALKLAGVTTREDRAAVLAHARFRQNISGGTMSSWIGAAADNLRRAGSAQALRAQDQADNEALMARDRARTGR